MPRSQTGNPRGRPRGSGLGVGDEAPRLMVRFPVDLYTRLTAFAEQYRYHRSDPPLAVCVRAMVTFCLDHPDLFRQPTNAPLPLEGTGETFRQSETCPSPVPQAHRTHYRQPRNTLMPSETLGEIFRQSENTLARAAQEHSAFSRQPENITEGYDASKFYLGKLCPKGHRYGDSGLSLLRRHNNGCRECENQAKRAKRAARRTAAAREG